MLFYLREDEHGWIYQPHGTEPEVWDTTLEGSEMLKASGWRPYQMHRANRHLHEELLGRQLLRYRPLLKLQRLGPTRS